MVLRRTLRWKLPPPPTPLPPLLAARAAALPLISTPPFRFGAARRADVVRLIRNVAWIECAVRTDHAMKLEESAVVKGP